MVARRREETVGGCAGPIRSGIWVNELVIILTNILINGRGITKRIIVVARGDDEIGIPAFDEVCNIRFSETVTAVISNDREADKVSLNGRYRGTQG